MTLWVFRFLIERWEHGSGRSAHEPPRPERLISYLEAGSHFGVSVTRSGNGNTALVDGCTGGPANHGCSRPFSGSCFSWRLVVVAKAG